MTAAPLLALALLFAELSLLAFGGGPTVLPEMQRRVVEVHGWMTAAQFTALFGLAQAAPGPNMMVVTLLGWRVAGFWGALAATAAMFGPSSVVTGVALRVWERFRHAPWRRAVQAGLVPITGRAGGGRRGIDRLHRGRDACARRGDGGDRCAVHHDAAPPALAARRGGGLRLAGNGLRLGAPGQLTPDQ